MTIDNHPKGKAATIIIDEKDAEVVQAVAGDFRDNINRVSIQLKLDD